MADALDYILKLTDQMSGPAKNAAAAMGQVNDALTKINKAAAGAKEGTEGVGKATEGIAAGGAMGAASMFMMGASMVNVGEIMTKVQEKAIELAKAIVETGVELVKFAFESADAHRSLLLVLEGIAGTEEGAKGMMEAIENVARTTPATTQQLEELARHLANAGLGADQFEQTLHSLAAVASVEGQAAADKLQALIDKSVALGKFTLPTKGLVGTGVSLPQIVKQIAADTGKSFQEVEAAMKAGKISTEEGIKALNEVIANGNIGKVLQRQMLSLPVQFEKFKSGLARLFDTVDIEPFLKGLHSVLELFDDSTASGKALKMVLGTVFTGMFDIASKVFPYVKAFFTGLVIAILKTYIAMKPVIKVFSDMIDAMGGGDSVLQLFVAMGQELGFLIGVAAVVVAVVVSAFVAIVNAIQDAIGFVEAIAGAIWKFVSDVITGAHEAGTGFIDGFINGIEGSIGAVIDAVKGVGNAALGALKSVLSSHSPSLATMQIGGDTGEGMALGIEKKQGRVEGAMGDMFQPPPQAVSMAAGGSMTGVSGGSAGGGAKVDVGGITITIEGVAGAEDVAQKLPAQLAAAFESIAASLGQAPARV